ncbi:hypothetical protein CBR65_20830 [Cellvibrio sp. PSBB006]|nr:hypothetical protein CBR65_20830 [Cellvibrio sp. PSBB006]
MALNLFFAPPKWTSLSGHNMLKILPSLQSISNFSRFPAVIMILFSLTACGGGGGGGGNGGKPTPPPSDPFADLDPAVMNTTFKKLSDTRYTGKTTTAEINEETLPVYVEYLFQRENDGVVSPGFKPSSSSVEEQKIKKSNRQPQLFMNEIASDLTKHIDVARLQKGSLADEEVDERIDCDESGYFTVKGIESESHAEVVVTYFSCRFDGVLYNGKYAVVGDYYEDASQEGLYYDRLSVTLNGQRWIASGYSSREFSYSSFYGYTFVHYVTLTNETNNEQYKLENLTENVNYYEVYTPRINGTLFIGSLGKVTVIPTQVGSNIKISGSGEAVGHVNFHDYAVIVAIDYDGDDVLDVGTSLADFFQFDSFAATDPVFVPIDDINFPPQIYYFYWENWSATTLTPLVVTPPDTYDVENDPLSISYEWYINNVLSSLSSSTTFPANVAVYGDTVSVVAVVSDGFNTTRSSRLDIYIDDAPGVVSIDTPTENVIPGELVAFSAVLIDPDNGNVPQALPMISAPPGAVIDEDGQVEWIATAPLFGNVMSYSFVFDASTDEYYETKVERQVTVTDATKKMPTAYSDIRTSTRPHSLWVGDFDGDDNNEILTTDGNERVMLVSFTGEGYEQSWLYPLSLNTENNIIRVLPADLDEDSAQEILVLGNRNINIILDLDAPAEQIELLEDSYFHAAQIADIDVDGTPELITLVSDSSYYGSQPRLVVYDLPSGEQLRSINLVSPAEELVVGNVDEDSALEVVLSNGLVYDTVTWANQWYYGDGFGSKLDLGDVDNNGVEEIISLRDTYSASVVIFDAVAKSQRMSIDDLYACNILVNNFDADAQAEILVSSCGWDESTIYDVASGAAVIDRTLSETEYSNAYGLAIGDSNNDGINEIHQAGGGTSLTVLFSDDQWNNGTYWDYFSAAGWLNRTPDAEQESVFIVQQRGDAQGQHLLFVQENGATEKSALLNSWTTSGLQGVTTDYDQNGYGDVFFIGANDYYSGQEFQAFQASNLSEIWSSGSTEYNSGLRAPTAFDINGDDLMDGIYIDDNKLIMTDISEAAIISSDIVNNQIRDYAIVDRPDLDTIDVIVSSWNELQVWRKDGVSFSLVMTTPVNCERLLAREEQGQVKIYCYGSIEYETGLLGFSYQDDVFDEAIKSWEIPGYLIDMAFSADPAQPSHLYIGARNPTSYYDDHFIGAFDLESGGLIGKMNILGSFSSRSIFNRVADEGESRLMFNTDKAMYLVH